MNNCLDYHRASAAVFALLDGLDEVLDTFRAPRESALSDLLREEQEERVQQVVAQLPEEQRIVVVLRYTEGLSYEEIADLLGCRRGTVASRLNRAHKALERRLSKSSIGKAGKGIATMMSKEQFEAELSRHLAPVKAPDELWDSRAGRERRHASVRPVSRRGMDLGSGRSSAGGRSGGRGNYRLA